MQANGTCGNQTFLAAIKDKIIKIQTTENYKAYVTYNQTQSTYGSTFIILHLFIYLFMFVFINSILLWLCLFYIYGSVVVSILFLARFKHDCSSHTITPTLQ